MQRSGGPDRGRSCTGSWRGFSAMQTIAGYAAILASVAVCALAGLGLCAAGTTPTPTTTRAAAGEGRPVVPPTPADLAALEAAAERPLALCDAEWLARELSKLPTRKSGGKPIIWAGWSVLGAIRHYPAAVQLVRTTNAVGSVISKYSGRTNRPEARWYATATALAEKYDAPLTATIFPLQFYWHKHIHLEPEAWHGNPSADRKSFAAGVCLNYPSKTLDEDFRRMKLALLEARGAGLKPDYFYVDLEWLAASRWPAMVKNRAMFEQCPRCRGLAGLDRGVLALTRRISATIREVYPESKQVWYNLGWTSRKGVFSPRPLITRYWPTDLEVADIAAPPFYFGGDEPAYAETLDKLVAVMPAGAKLAPTIITFYATYPKYGIADFDACVMARVTGRYLDDDRLAALSVAGSIHVPAAHAPDRHLIANRHLYAVAWAACRR